MNEQEKYNVIKELVDHNGIKNRAAKKLGISRRQVDRLIIIYKEKGNSGFVHGNRDRKPKSTLDKSISEDIILLYKTKYQDWNFQHFKEFLEKDITKRFHVSPNTVERIINSYYESKKVKLIIIDMYSPYVSLIKSMFSNASIIIDKFHLVNLISTSFNKIRIKARIIICKNLLHIKKVSAF